MQEKNKKIGVVTFWWSQDNYGQLLQAFALQTVLKQMDCNPFLINIRTTDVGSLTAQIKAYLKRTYINILIKYFQPQMRKKEFDSFRLHNLNIGKVKYKSLTELRKNPPVADYYICGSDQIWNYSLDNNQVALLDFGNAQKVAYAASFGRKYEDITSVNLRVFVKNLPKFKAIGVREESAVETCRKLGYPNAVWVPDPTLLLTAEDYNNFLIKNSKVQIWNTEKKKILIYTIGNRTIGCKDKVILYLKNQKEYDVIHVSSQGDFSGNSYPTIENWLCLYKQADFVLTNSFHGACFSVLFNKEFAVLPCDSGHAEMNERIFSLLKKTNLEDKLLVDFQQIREMLIEQSDWERVNQAMAAWRIEANEFLKANVV